MDEERVRRRASALRYQAALIDAELGLAQAKAKAKRVRKALRRLDKLQAGLSFEEQSGIEKLRQNLQQRGVEAALAITKHEDTLGVDHD